MAVSEGPLSGLICEIGELFSWSRKCYISQKKRQGISNYLQGSNTMSFLLHSNASIAIFSIFFQ